MRHEARAWAEDREIRTTLLHQLELVGLDRFAQRVVADDEVCDLRHLRGILDTRDLLVAPFFERLRCRRVVAVAVDDHRVFPVCLSGCARAYRFRRRYSRSLAQARGGRTA